MEGKTSKTPVESSQPHEFLLSFCGDWEGGCKTWFEPEKLVDESPIRCSIQPLLKGRFIQMDYDGSLMDEAMHGRVIFGYYELRQRYEAAWINNLHMGTGILFSTGKAIPNGFFASKLKSRHCLRRLWASVNSEIQGRKLPD